MSDLRMRPDVSVIIVTFNSGPMVLDAIRSVSDTAGDLTVEVFVVDNASADGTPGMVAEAFPQVRLIRSAENRGFAAANNLALREAAGEYVLLLNPDARLEPHALARMRAFLRGNPPAGIVGARLRDDAGRIALSAYPAYTPADVLWRYSGLNRMFPYRFTGRYRRVCEKATEPVQVEWVQGAAMMFRREVHEQIGGLDEGFFLFSEEPDFCDRAQRAGWLTYYLPTAEAQHVGSATVSSFSLTRVRSYHQSPVHYFRKRGRAAAITFLKMVFTLELAAKIVIRYVEQRVRPSEYAAERLQAYRTVLRELPGY